MCLGKPKSAEQKRKMSEAKKGKPKSQAHKDAMRETWKKKRQAKYQQAMQTLNNINSQRQVAWEKYTLKLMMCGVLYDMVAWLVRQLTSQLVQ